MTEVRCPCCGGEMTTVRETGERMLLKCISCSMTEVRLKTETEG